MREQLNAMRGESVDRVGIGWRGELAARVLGNLHRIDLVEVVAEDWFDAPRSRLRALRTLGARVPVVIHGVSLGLASTLPVDRRRLDAMARVVGAAEPESWSEHLAFVRAGGREIGHLAAPPRNVTVLEGLARNAAASARAVGSVPLLENVATLVDPPGSDLSEAEFLEGALGAGGGDLLLDLHNLHANSVNFGFPATDVLDRIPPERIGLIHIAGGRWVGGTGPRGNGERRLLDDHRHLVPDPVYGLLEEVASRATRPLSVVLERDGAYPEFDALLAELDLAREAIRRGRSRSAAATGAPAVPRTGRRITTGPAFEAFLARIFTEDQARTRFLADPAGEARRAGLGAEEAASLADGDLAGMEFAGESFAAKRAAAASGRD